MEFGVKIELATKETVEKCCDKNEQNLTTGSSLGYDEANINITQEPLNENETKTADIDDRSTPIIKSDDIINSIEFDAFIDEKSRIHRKYNLRKQPKVKTNNLNENKIYQKLLSHRDTIEKLKDEFQCDQCSKTFAKKMSYTYHMRSHIEKNIFTCYKCNVEFESNKDLLEHKTVHQNEECYKCDTCQIAFSKEASYVSHTYNHKKPPYKCGECLFTTKDIHTIKPHVAKHFGDTTTCDICNKLINKRRIKAHIKEHNTKIECGECGKICNTKKNHEYHMIAHTGVKPYQCLYCGKGFSNLSQQKVHTRIHTGLRKYECKVCYMTFVQSTDLKKHSNVHEEKRFECDYCGKKFLHKESIKYHIRLHTNYKPYKCPECKMGFATSTHLTVHTYHFHMEKQFPCELCNHKFATRSGYKKHVNSKVHQNNLYGASKRKRAKC